MLSPAICYEEFEERYSQEVATLIPEQAMPPKVLIRMEKAWRGHSVAIIVPVREGSSKWPRLGASRRCRWQPDQSSRAFRLVLGIVAAIGRPVRNRAPSGPSRPPAMTPAEVTNSFGPPDERQGNASAVLTKIETSVSVSMRAGIALGGVLLC